MLATVLLLAALPLIEKPVAAPNNPYFAVFLTGDGGWRAIDAQITERLNARGIPVVGLLSNRYFSESHRPEQVAHDVEGVINTYAAHWHKPKIILIGFSRGADAIPAILAHIPSALRARVAVAAMLGPATRMELRASQWWEVGHDPPSVPLLPLVRAARGVRLLCVHGTDEDDSLCGQLARGEAIDLPMEGGHHFGGRYDVIADAIVNAAGK
jgi:type IV secretory pathway VirJ component